MKATDAMEPTELALIHEALRTADADGYTPPLTDDGRYDFDRCTADERADFLRRLVKAACRRVSAARNERTARAEAAARVARMEAPWDSDEGFTPATPEWLA